MGQLLGHVRDGIGRADGEGAVEHTAQKRHAARPARDVVLVETAPDEFTAGVAGRHGRHDDDGHEPAHDDEEHTKGLGERDQAVGEDDDEEAQPRDEHVGDVDLPGVVDVGRLVVYDVQVDRDVGCDLDQRGQVEHPAVEVDPAGEEAQHAAPARPGGDGGPMVDATCCRDGGGELAIVLVESFFSITRSQGSGLRSREGGERGMGSGFQSKGCTRTSARPRPMKE